MSEKEVYLVEEEEPETEPSSTALPAISDPYTAHAKQQAASRFGFGVGGAILGAACLYGLINFFQPGATEPKIDLEKVAALQYQSESDRLRLEERAVAVALYGPDAAKGPNGLLASNSPPKGEVELTSALQPSSTIKVPNIGGPLPSTTPNQNLPMPPLGGEIKPFSPGQGEVGLPSVTAYEADGNPISKASDDGDEESTMISVEQNVKSAESAHRGMAAAAKAAGGTAEKYLDVSEGQQKPATVLFVPEKKVGEVLGKIQKSGNVSARTAWNGKSRERKSKLVADLESRVKKLERERDDLLKTYFEDAIPVKQVSEDLVKAREALKSAQKAPIRGNTAVIKVTYSEGGA